ncbi:ribonuclease H-like domain-containing protein [Tanacetum coccineum]
MALTAEENFGSESDTEDPPFKKITFNTDYKIKTSLEEPHMDLELKALPDNLEYAILEEPSFLPNFDIEIKDKKGVENVAADHLSRIKNDETSDDSDVDDNFPGETLMEITTNDTSWFADFANYLVDDVIPKGMTYQQKNKFFVDLKNYFWEDPYLFKLSVEGFDNALMLGLKDFKMILRVTTAQEVIKNCNKVLKRTVGETEQEYEPTTAKEKQDRRNEIKVRGTLLMALPHKDQLKFHSYKFAKFLMKAIEKRETMDQTFDRLQKLITQLEIQGEVITQEDMNLKLLRSLPSEWKTHALIWRNKHEIETIILDDLYNNLKIYEPKISRSSSTSQNPQNEADNTAYGVSAAHTQSNPTTGNNLSDAVICAFLASHPNSPQMLREDLEQIDPDELEEMDLQWEMAMLTIRARRFIKRTGRQLDVNGQKVRFDRSKVECYNCHKYGHFAREYGIRGYDWSYQAEEEHPTNFALMAHTSSGSSSSSDSEVDSCSKSCVTAYATLKEQYDSLSSDYRKSQFNLVSYKAGLESVEARLAHYKKILAVFEESINVLKLEVKLRDTALVENKKKLEKAEKERDELKLTLEKFQNSSKSLNNLLESQVIDKFKTGLGYNAASSTAASPAVESFVNSSEMLENQENNKSKSDKGYHAVPPPLQGISYLGARISSLADKAPLTGEDCNNPLFQVIL